MPGTYFVPAPIESIVEPDGITDDVAWKSVSLISIHLPILAIWASYLGDTCLRERGVRKLKWQSTLRSNLRKRSQASRKIA